MCVHVRVCVCVCVCVRVSVSVYIKYSYVCICEYNRVCSECDIHTEVHVYRCLEQDRGKHSDDPYTLTLASYPAVPAFFRFQ